MPKKYRSYNKEYDKKEKRDKAIRYLVYVENISPEDVANDIFEGSITPKTARRAIE